MTKRKPKCISGEQVSGSYSGLLDHIGHNVVCVCYGDMPEPANVAIECEDCGCVLVDFNYVDETACQKCGSKLRRNGKCSDQTCPYSDRQQHETFTEG